MQQAPQQQPIVTPYTQYINLAKAEEDAKKTIGPQKKALHGIIEQEMLNTNRHLFSEDGQHYFVLTPKKTKKTALTQDFLRLCYERFQRSKRRQIDADESQDFIDYVENCRDSDNRNDKPAKRMKYQKSRPAEAFFYENHDENI